MIKLVIHKTCPTSLKVMLFLKERGLLRDAEIIDAEEDPFKAIQLGVLSVPAIFVDEKIVAMGPVDFESLNDRLSGKKIYAENINAKYGLKQTFIAILDSLGTASWVYFREDIKDILEYRVLVEPAIGIVDWEESKKESYLKEVYDYFLSKKNMFMKTYSTYFFKNFTKNFIREQYWLHGIWPDENVFNIYTLEVFTHWLILRSAIGRIGMKMDALKDPRKKELAEKAYNGVKERFNSILKEVKKEAEYVEEMQRKLEMT